MGGARKSAADPVLAPELPFTPDAVADRLLAWYGREGRDLPWRHSRDPYRVWLSEIMLQQTTVGTVIPYFTRFLQHFPTVAALAAADIDEVIALWAGLGYYSRARNLHAAAQVLVAEHGGRFPDSLEGLLGLPGVGRSTAGAILSIAFDIKAPILDGNVRRVLCRLFALQENPRSSAAEKKLWCWAELLTPAGAPHDYAQAMMDLGATICVPRRPRCPACPLSELCRARILGLEADLPLKIARKPVPLRSQVALLIERDGAVLVRRRPYEGLLGGMWELPTAEFATGEEAAGTARRLGLHLGGAAPSPVGMVKHIYSHFRLELHIFRCRPAIQIVAEGTGAQWIPAADLQSLALHGAHQKALRLLAPTD